MRTCGRCPVYDPDLRLCLRTDEENGVEYGCGCVCFVKALTTDVCWADENGYEFGWELTKIRNERNSEYT